MVCSDHEQRSWNIKCTGYRLRKVISPKNLDHSSLKIPIKFDWRTMCFLTQSVLQRSDRRFKKSHAQTSFNQYSSITLHDHRDRRRILERFSCNPYRCCTLTLWCRRFHGFICRYLSCTEAKKRSQNFWIGSLWGNGSCSYSVNYLDFVRCSHIRVYRAHN